MPSFNHSGSLEKESPRKKGREEKKEEKKERGRRFGRWIFFFFSFFLLFFFFSFLSLFLLFAKIMSGFFGKLRTEALKLIDDDDMVSQSGDFDDGASVDSESLDIQAKYERAQAKIAKYQKKFAGESFFLLLLFFSVEP